MATFNIFAQKQKDKPEQVNLLLTIKYHCNSFRYGFGVSIPVTRWDMEKQRILPTKKNETVAENTLIARVLLAGDAVYKKFYTSGEYNPREKLTKELRQKLRIELDKILNRERQRNIIAEKNKIGFIAFGLKFSETKKGVHMKSFMGKFAEYLLKMEGKTEIDFNDIDLDFYERLKHYYTYEMQYSVNTIGRYIGYLKEIMTAAKKQHTNTDYLDFSGMSEDSGAVYLSEEHIMTLYKLDLSKQPNLESTRDLFVIGCYTALRYSDLSTFGQNNIENNMIKIQNFKTTNLVYIPIHPLVEEIMRKYNGKAPKVTSNSDMNEYIKVACEMAGLTHEVERLRTVRGKKTRLQNPFYELVTVHTSRRSFASNAFLAGMNTLHIMAITGHKTESEFMKYIRVSKEDRAKKAAEHQFFNWSNSRIEEISTGDKKEKAA